MPVKAVGFDIDGTLYPDIRAHWHSFLFVSRHYRVLLAFSRTRRIMRTDGRDDEDAELQIFARQMRVDINRAREIRDTIVYKGWEKCFRRIRTYKGVRDSLLRLKEAGLKIAALSDFPVGRKLEYFGLEDLFDVILGFPESQKLKPSPEPFLLMASRLGIDPTDILYIGNKIEYDVRGAEYSGMMGALIGSYRYRIPADITVFPNYAAMADSILS